MNGFSNHAPLPFDRPSASSGQGQGERLVINDLLLVFVVFDFLELGIDNFFTAACLLS